MKCVYIISGQVVIVEDLAAMEVDKRRQVYCDYVRGHDLGDILCRVDVICCNLLSLDLKVKVER